MIIGLVGKAQAGKDTVADYLVKHFFFQKAAFADDLKALCKDMFNLTDAQVNTQEGKAAIDVRYGITPREILQKVGTDWFRSVYPMIWVDRLCNRLKREPNVDHVITDIRFPNEAMAIQQAGGLIVKLVRTDGNNLGALSNHPSETAFDSFEDSFFDAVIKAESGALQKLYDGIVSVIES